MWTPSKIFAGATLFHALAALEKLGVVQFLRERQSGAEVGEISAERRIARPDLLEELLKYVALNMPSVFGKIGRKYTLRNYDPFANPTQFLTAYEPVAARFAELIAGNFVYGREVARDASHLMISSELYNRAARASVVELFKRRGIRRLVDLGCGSGLLLIQACESFPKLLGIGVERDPAALAIARESIGRSDPLVAKRIRVIAGDLAEPAEWKGVVGGGGFSDTAFVGVTVWHELLVNNDERLRSAISSYKKLFPGAMMVIAEYNGCPHDSLAELAEPLREDASTYQLFHPFSAQGMPQPPEAWTRLLAVAGVSLEEVLRVPPNSSIYVGTV